MDGIYKIESNSEPSAMMIENFIMSMGGKCVVQGSAVITNYDFESADSLWLLPFISMINDRITSNDINCWKTAC